MGSRKEENKRAKGKSPELSARDLGISLNPPCLFLSFSIFDLERPNVYSRDSRVSDPFLSILNLFLLFFASRPFFGGWEMLTQKCLLWPVARISGNINRVDRPVASYILQIR